MKLNPPKKVTFWISIFAFVVGAAMSVGLIPGAHRHWVYRLLARYPICCWSSACSSKECKQSGKRRNTTMFHYVWQATPETAMPALLLPVEDSGNDYPIDSGKHLYDAG